MKVFRQVVSGAYRERGVAMESFSDIVHGIKSLFSNKPNLTKKGNMERQDHQEDYFKDLQASVKEHYGNPEWLAQQQFHTGPVDASGIAEVFCVNGHNSSNILNTAKNDIRLLDDIVKKFYAAAVTRQVAARKLFDEAKKKGGDAAFDHIKSGMASLPSPWEEVKPDFTKVSGGFRLEMKSGPHKDVKVERDKSSNASSTLKALTKEEMVEYSKVLTALVDTAMHFIGTYDEELLDHAPGNWDLEEELDESLEDMPTDRAKDLYALSIDGLHQAQMHVVWKLAFHLVDEAAALEKLMHRSIK